MPIYTYRCFTCGHETAIYYSSFNDRDSSLLCSICKGRMQVVPSVPRIDFTMKYYRDLEKSGKAVYEKGMDRDAKRNKKAIEDKEDKKRLEFIANKVREFPYSASEEIKGD